MQPRRSSTLGGDLAAVRDGLSRLAAAHVALARAELHDAAVRTFRGAGPGAAAAALLTAGWLLFAVASGFGLGARIGLARGFLVVSAVHVLAGLVMAGVASRRHRARRGETSLDTVREEWRHDRELLTRLRRVRT